MKNEPNVKRMNLNVEVPLHDAFMELIANEVVIHYNGDRAAFAMH